MHGKHSYRSRYQSVRSRIDSNAYTLANFRIKDVECISIMEHLRLCRSIKIFAVAGIAQSDNFICFAHFGFHEIHLLVC